jgi:hypothetical protein
VTVESRGPECRNGKRRFSEVKKRLASRLVPEVGACRTPVPLILTQDFATKPILVQPENFISPFSSRCSRLYLVNSRFYGDKPVILFLRFTVSLLPLAEDHARNVRLNPGLIPLKYSSRTGGTLSGTVLSSISVCLLCGLQTGKFLKVKHFNLVVLI